MEIMEIIKEGFIFPSNNLEKLAIYIVLTFAIGILMIVGSVFVGLAADSNAGYIILAVIFAIAGILLALIISGYQIKIIKAGIDREEKVEGFDWKEDFITGIKYLIVSIVYFIIPMIVTVLMALVTNIPGQFLDIVEKAAVTPANATAAANATAPVITVSDSAITALGSSIAITAIVAIVVFIIFAFLETMGEARLANTGSLGEAVNFSEAFNDLKKVGVGKVFAVVIIVFVIILVINGILGYIYGQIPYLSIISVVVTPYLMFFSRRVVGTLYSEIA